MPTSEVLRAWYLTMDTTRTLLHALIDASLAGDSHALLMLKTLVGHLDAQQLPR